MTERRSHEEAVRTGSSRGDDSSVGDQPGLCRGMVLGQSMVALMPSLRLEYVVDRMTFTRVEADEVARIVGGKRDAEVLAWSRR